MPCAVLKTPRPKLLIIAWVEGPPSPEKPPPRLFTSPATVEMIWFCWSTRRTTLLLPPPIYRFSRVSTTICSGKFISASVAEPPSPPKPGLPLNATVEMVPCSPLIIRITLSPLSATNTSVSPSNNTEEAVATPKGVFSKAEVGGPPSPQFVGKVLQDCPGTPANVLMFPPETTRMVFKAMSEM